MNICYIFGAVKTTMPEIQFHETDLIIAADAGYLTLKSAGIKPSLVVGDFDSLGSEPKNENIVRHPVHKDDTDTMLAVKLALDKGFKDFRIYGIIGGRLDQTLASIATLLYITERGGTAVLVGENECITALKNSSITFKPHVKGVVSVFSFGCISNGVYLKNLLYPLTDAVITPDFPLGVSNEFIDKEASVTVKNGTLTVIWHGEPGDIIKTSEE